VAVVRVVPKGVAVFLIDQLPIKIRELLETFGSARATLRIRVPRSPTGAAQGCPSRSSPSRKEWRIGIGA
jgi:hypothetical protein